ncbi:hypothetical protein J31TS3_42490 [Paenibacillus lactis]|nr:hypothetical protein J31TS3_42490 [Paenibacillus lactis]
MDQERLVRVFQHFADKEFPGSSDLYAHLARQIAGDAEVLSIAAQASPGQPVPNLLFGAVQYLLLKGKGAALSAYYPGLAEQPKEMEASYPHFRSFVLEHREGIIEILRSKRVQTNEVRRCAYLYPVFCSVYAKVRKPLALVELGCSAGLQLLWDQYSYAYGGQEIYGKKESAVRIDSEIRGGKGPVSALFQSPGRLPDGDRSSRERCAQRGGCIMAAGAHLAGQPPPGIDARAGRSSS